MEDVVESKGIERVVEEVKATSVAKPKKERSQAQKEAFEKARKKRAENLSKKKESEELDAWAESEVDKELPKVADIKPPPNKRGRPKKVMNRRPEPQAPQYVPPLPHGQYSQYPIMGSSAYQYYQPPPQQQPVVNNYYYGEQHHHAQGTASQGNAREQKTTTPVLPQFEPEPSPEGSIVDSDEEEYQPQVQFDNTPQLKYRFA